MGILNLNTYSDEYSAVTIIGIGNNKREFNLFIKLSKIKVKLYHPFLIFSMSLKKSTLSLKSIIKTSL